MAQVIHTQGEGNGTPLQYSCLENPRDGGSLVGCRLWGRTESDTTEATQPQQQQQQYILKLFTKIYCNFLDNFFFHLMYALRKFPKDFILYTTYSSYGCFTGSIPMELHILASMKCSLFFLPFHLFFSIFIGLSAHHHQKISFKTEVIKLLHINQINLTA